MRRTKLKDPKRKSKKKIENSKVAFYFFVVNSMYKITMVIGLIKYKCVLHEIVLGNLLVARLYGSLVIVISTLIGSSNQST